MPQRPHSERAAPNTDRRLTPRYACCGQAQIMYLPSDGTLFGGRLRNLGWGGCYIETGSPFVIGARTEVLVKANALWFRAMAQVRAIREKSGIGLEFIRLSTGGYRSLAEVLVELAQQAALGPCASTKDNVISGSQAQSSRYILAPGSGEGIALVTTVVGAKNSDARSPQHAAPILESHPQILEPWPSGSILDLFG
jgi:hypothetical protein